MIEEHSRRQLHYHVTLDVGELLTLLRKKLPDFPGGDTEVKITIDGNPVGLGSTVDIHVDRYEETIKPGGSVFALPQKKGPQAGAE